MKRFLAAVVLGTLRQILTTLIVLSASTYMSGSKSAELTANRISAPAAGDLDLDALRPLHALRSDLIARFDSKSWLPEGEVFDLLKPSKSQIDYFPFELECANF